MRVSSLALASFAILGCSQEPDDGRLTDAEKTALVTLGPIGDPPPNPSNAVADDPLAIELGEALFFEPRFSLAGSDLACADCHQTPLGWGDDRPFSPNANGVDSARHSQTLTNVAYNDSFFWDGRSDTLWGQSYIAVVNVHKIKGDEANPDDFSDEIAVLDFLAADYGEMYVELFEPLPDPLRLTADQFERVLVNCSKAIEAYERTMTSTNAPLDQWLLGDKQAVTDEQVRGAQLFVGKAGCIECHSGPNLTDGWFHNIGLALGADNRDAAMGLTSLPDSPFNAAGEHSDDPEWGQARLDEIAERFADAGDALIGAHKTPSLRDVTKRPLYGHDGRTDDLREWIERYRDADVDDAMVGDLDPAYIPRDLSDDEITDLIAFLGALTGDLPDGF